MTDDDKPCAWHHCAGSIPRGRLPISLYRVGSRLRVGYGWGDRALFQAEFDYHTVIRQLRA